MVRTLLVVLCVLCVAACSASDEQPDSTESSQTSEAPVASAPTVLIVDASGSMTQDDAPGVRMDAAKRAGHGLLYAMPDDMQVGLVTYGTGTGSADAEKPAGCVDVDVAVSLSRLDRGRLGAAIDALNPSGYTPIAAALRIAADQLPEGGAPQSIVLLSDGEDTCDQPPCEVARELKRDHPGLAISTVGFKTEGLASEQLSCIATSTGGLFVQAGNANQLAARLAATQDVAAANESLTPSSFAGVAVGTTATDIRAANADFPAVAPTGSVVVVWKDCEFTFADGVLDSIAPRSGRTIDGVAVGSAVTDAVRFYGEPVAIEPAATGTAVLTFAADEAAGTAFRITVSGHTAGATGTVQTIVLCRCLPAKEPVATLTGWNGIEIGMTRADAEAALTRAGITYTARTGNNPSCVNLNGPQTTDYVRALQVTIGKNGTVVGIDTPGGTITERGVGDGSTPAEIRAAYGTGFVVEQGLNAGQGIEGVKVSRSGGGPSEYVNFPVLDGGIVGPPSIGTGRYFESCI